MESPLPFDEPPRPVLTSSAIAEELSTIDAELQHRQDANEEPLQVLSRSPERFTEIAIEALPPPKREFWLGRRRSSAKSEADGATAAAEGGGSPTKEGLAVASTSDADGSASKRR